MPGEYGDTSSPVPHRVRAAYAYLGAVTERPTAQLWDLVDAVGPVEAQDRIDLGKPVMGGLAVPVVIKTLLFEK